MSTPCCDTVIHLVTSCNYIKPHFIWNLEHFFSVKDLISTNQKPLSLQTRNRFLAVSVQTISPRFGKLCPSRMDGLIQCHTS